MRGEGARQRWLISGITLAAFFLYVYRLPVPPLRGDEAFTAVFSRWPLAEIWHALRSTEPHPPLYYLLMHTWLSLVGNSELTLRFLSFLPGVLLVPITYILGRLWRCPRVGLWAAFLVAINPFLIWHAQDARMYTLLAALSLGSLASAIALLRGQGFENVGAQGAGGKLVESRLWGRWSGYVLITLAALSTHYYALLTLLAENLVFIVSLFRRLTPRSRVSRWLSVQIALALLFGPWLLYAGGFMLGHQKDWIAPVGLLTFLRRILSAFSLGPTLNTPRAWPWLLAFAALWALGAFLSWAGDRRHTPLATAMLWSACLVPSVVTFLVSLRRPLFDERYLIAAAPIHLLFVGKGLAWLGRRWWPLSYSLCAFLALGSGLALYRYHFSPQHAKSPDWRGAIAYAVEHVEPQDLLILNYPDPAQEYYNAGRLPYILLPERFPVDAEGTRQALARLAEAHPRLWLVPTRAENWDREGLVESWLDRYADLVEERRFRGLRLKRYHTAQRYLQEMEPVEVEIGGLVRLLGFTLSMDGRRIAPAQAIAPGSTLRLTLYWEVLARAPTQYTTFTHLLDSEGVMRGQKDSPPLGGAYPMTEWQPGERLVDYYDLSVDPNAPAGTYRLQVGLYVWPSLERLPITDARGQPVGDQWLLTTLVLGQPRSADTGQ